MAKGMFNVDNFVKAIRKKQDTIDRNSRKLKSAPKYILVGWDQSSGTYPEQDGKPVWYIAKIHEYGLGNQTAKGMIGNTIFENEDKWIAKYRKLAYASLKKGKLPDYYQITEAVGQQMKRDLENHVYAIDLVDTQRLANSVIIKYRRR